MRVMRVMRVMPVRDSPADRTVRAGGSTSGYVSASLREPTGWVPVFPFTVGRIHVAAAP
ncbi:hypothetical protein HHL19_21770 [Streptomyces sp. R302]|uniref:hypothetical protein n=1 Tax=unclassified Streptomyces TaxID=2593676 RepID=UPI00145C6AD7|nr:MULTISPECIES: hypothetical protein [unclassified Streptomyces]NML51603.1 hypothetical protein [Streptomyces sp. R301]NML81223.1 hypothetical protein [Streptomyces sp. R302]